jgi:hypothetical protein
VGSVVEGAGKSQSEKRKSVWEKGGEERKKKLTSLERWGEKQSPYVPKVAVLFRAERGLQIFPKTCLTKHYHLFN